MTKSAFLRLLEGITEFIATLWSRNSTDFQYEAHPDLQTHKMTLALVSALSRETENLNDIKVIDEDFRRGATDASSDDLTTGIDILCQAYFTGDPIAVEKLGRAARSLVATQAFDSPSSYYGVRPETNIPIQ